MITTPNNITRKQVEEQFVYDRLSSLCTFICTNHEKIVQELLTITKILSIAETCSIAYNNIEFVTSHIKRAVPEFNIEALSVISKRLGALSKGADIEFFQNINFLNIIDEISSKNNIGVAIIFIWKAQKISHRKNKKIRRY